MAEEITKVIENVDELFPEIIVNGESHISDRYVEPEPTPSQSLPQSSEEQTEEPSQPQQNVQGEYVDTLELNGVRHDLKDSPLTQSVDTLSSELIVAQADISDIQALIPNQATPQNQLADKDFVNSSIATNTATFRGTYTTLAQIEAIPNPTNNDYAYLETTDSVGNNRFDRYKYSSSDSQWHYEYTLNNSSFTAEQWATINSGLTQSSVEADIASAINALDVAVVGGSGKYIKSISQVDGKIVAEADWLSSTGGGVAFIGTRAQYETAKLIPLGQTGHIPSGALVIITDEDDYLNSEDK